MKSLLIFLLTIQSILVVAQDKFISRDLQQLFESLPAGCKQILFLERECDCPIEGEVLKVRSETEHNQITHVGLKFLHDSVRNIYSRPIILFVEKELLRFILSNPEARNLRLKEEHVNLTYSNFFQKETTLKLSSNVHCVIKDLNEVSITRSDTKYQIFLTNSTKEKLGIEFPAINSLLTGMDKKELEDQFINALKESGITQTKDKIETPQNNLLSDGNLLYTAGDNYLSKEFSNRVYFIRSESNLELVFQPQYVTESFSNIFLGDFSTTPIYIRLKMKGYGNEEKTITIPLNRFLSYFEHPFKKYFGIEDSTANNLRGSLVLFNPEMNYMHLCDIKTTSANIFSESPDIEVVVYPFIPTHNIKDIYGVGESNKSIHLDDLIWESYEE